MDAHLSPRGWSFSQLAAQIEVVKHAVGSRSTNLPQRLGSSLLTECDALAGGHEALIAQVREPSRSASHLSPLERHAQMRIHPHSLESRPLATPTPEPTSFSQHTGVWLCAFESASTHRFQATAPFASQKERGYRPRQQHDSHWDTRAVLEQQNHWFRCFPSGESTIGAPLAANVLAILLRWSKTMGRSASRASAPRGHPQRGRAQQGLRVTLLCFVGALHAQRWRICERRRHDREWFSPRRPVRRRRLSLV